MTSIARAKMAQATVAVIGAGPAGLSMLKTLREDGFDATLFERRSQVGGLWAYSDNTKYTTALKKTRANLSKYTCGYTDFPIPDRFPPYLEQQHFQEFMQEYSEHFGLLDHIVFNAAVEKVYRDKTDSKWLLDIAKPNSSEVVEFDKVVFCHGYQTQKKMPFYPGQDQFTGVRIHAQEYRQPEDFKGKKVVVVGISSSADDCVPDILPHASKVYLSHRRGTMVGSRLRKGVPTDLLITWRRRIISQWLMDYAPTVHRVAAEQAVKFIAKSYGGGKMDPAWRLSPAPSPTLRPVLMMELLPYLKDGSLTSMHGIKRFTGERSIEFEDGQVLDDVDAVIFCTGYTADFSVAPFIETSTPTAHGYKGKPIARLYMNLFPPQYADSCAMLCYSALGKNNGFSFSDVISMAVSNVWRGVSSDMVPDREGMESWVDEQQAWVAGRWALDPYIDISMVRQWIFQPWCHAAAGTGMDNLGWGIKGWKFWCQDRKMYNLMNHGVETAHMFRYFETGKRKTWAGARDEIIRQNEIVKKIFPVKDEETAMTITI